VSLVTWDGPHFKVKTIKRDKGRKRRAAAAVVKRVRADVKARDGYCKIHQSNCEGPSEWAHLPGHTRAQTRGQAPELRHTVEGTAMLCKRHHDMLDGRRKDLDGVRSLLLDKN
jgi:hypothetical protein